MTELSKSESEIYSLRKEKEAAIRDSKIDSFPTYFENTTNASEILKLHSNLTDGEKTEISTSVRGRILSIRSFGKLTFMDLKDYSGKIQLVLSQEELSTELAQYIENYDVGDLVGVSGNIMKTKKGEISIKVTDSILLSKSLRNFPEKWHGLKDKETRFRQRYLDFIVNEDAIKTIQTRFQIIKLIREFMDSKHFIEVETPTLQPKAGGAIARPFTTHHNAMSIDMFLRIAPELYLKRLIIGGFEKVYEIGKVFRNEGIDMTHSPEFTMMESYQAYTNVNGVMDMVEEMCCYVFSKLNVNSEISYLDSKADFSFPWKRISMFDLVNNKFNLNIDFDSDINSILSSLEKNFGLTYSSKTIGLLVYELFENHIEKEIIDPTFVTDYPKEVSPFARESKEKQGITERFELFAFGSELANGFSELIDPEDQEQRLKEQAIKKSDGDDEAHVEDKDYIDALEYGLPPTGGLGFGIDRFVMMLTNNESIREVIAFPHLKPES
ncbi:MAG: lysine--tRNA ligase [Actinomycetota bacterium]|nr:lysine--tRNA ligase [Actinomycetota bacterium]MDA3013714.1 lysine--tRNA ligase [Actinomycetota bacterium]